MNELVSALRQFITRDVMYLLGGSCVLSSLLLLLNKTDLFFSTISTYETLLWVGIAYITGFAIQETLSLTPLVTTQNIYKPGAIVKYFYKRFTNNEWTDIDCTNWDSSLFNFEKNAPERTYQNYQRIISLKHIGTAAGSSLYVSSGLLLVYAICEKYIFSWVLFFGSTFLAISLAITAWVKGAQQTQFIIRWRDHGENA